MTWDQFVEGLGLFGFSVNLISSADGVELFEIVWQCSAPHCDRSVEIYEPCTTTHHPQVLRWRFEQLQAIQNVQRQACGHG